MHIVEYQEHHAAPLCEFNTRLREGGSELQLSAETRAGPRRPDAVTRTTFVALDDTGAIRGGYASDCKNYRIAGRTESVAFLKFPLSEGIVNRRYSATGFLLVRDFVARYPLCFGLGMGGVDRPLPTLLAKMKFRLVSVPFYFYICHPTPVLRNVVRLHQRRWTSVAAKLLAATRLASCVVPVVHRARVSVSGKDLRPDVRSQFGKWSDDAWETSAGEHSLIAVRNQPVMRSLYLPDDARLHRLSVSRNGAAIGMAIVTDSQMSGHNHVGDLRLGAIVDCLAAGEDRPRVVRTATDYLRRRGVDLIVSNQQDARWQRALESNGFLAGPSNFALATSPSLTARIAEVDPGFERVHLNRGDGDGPYNL